MKRFLLIPALMALLALSAFGGAQPEEVQPATAPGVDAEVWETPAVYATPGDFQRETGAQLPSYNEAPVFQERVEAGELPPVEDRLPVEPLVVRPWNQIGTYSEREIAADWRDLASANAQHLLEIIAPDFTMPVPNVLKGYDLSDDARSITLHLREGLRWSDGHPHTADDFVFWYEDVLNNSELTPARPAVYFSAGVFMDLTRIDDYTVRLDFAEPYPVILDVLASELWWQYPIPPKHYMQQWHIDYNPDAGALAREEGFETWYQAFLMHNATGADQQDVDRPTVYPWVLTSIDSAQNQYFERNPYFWKVDIAGNQLPYIGRMTGVRVGDAQVKQLRVISGDFHLGGVWQSVANYPLYLDNEERGNYRAMLWEDPRGSMDTAISLNQTSPDPVKREMFRDLRFRQALSLAIDREEMNETLFFGLGEPRQAAPPPAASDLFEEWMRDYYADYDPARANELLDEMGLQWDARREFRLRPDGQPVTINMQFVERYDPISQLLQEYWQAVGVRVTLRQVTGAMWTELVQANETDMGRWALENTDFTMRRTRAAVARPPWTGANYPWGTWYTTDGASGEEPPETVKELYRVIDEWSTTVAGTDRHIELGKEIWRINIENLFVIGAVGLVPYPVIITNSLGNTMPDESLWSPSYQQWVPYMAEQWFFVD